MPVARCAMWAVCACGALALGAGLGGCESSPVQNDGAPLQRAPLPDYNTVAAEFNANADRLARFRAQVDIRVIFFNRDGDRQTEECDGLLQVIRPDRMALSFRKVSQTLFWLGCNGSHYWWIDMTGDEPLAAIGRHEKFGPNQARFIGVAIQPLDLIRLLGCVPLPVDPRRPMGALQWSDDGTRLGVTISIGPRGETQRLWLDPATYLPVYVELYDARRKPVIVADLSQHEAVRQFEDGRPSPLLAGRVHINQLEQQTELRLLLRGMQDGGPKSERPISDSAFDFAAIASTFNIEKAGDLDSAPPPPTSSSPTATGQPSKPGAPASASPPPSKPSATPETGRAPR